MQGSKFIYNTRSISYVAFLIVKGEVSLYKYITIFNVAENGIVIYAW
jgi:hypothetical protein